MHAQQTSYDHLDDAADEPGLVHCVAQWCSYLSLLPVTAPLQITSAVLVAPGSVTHSFNTNQRVVKLVISSVNLSTMTLTLMVIGRGK